jgi:3-oxoacyl-[acyl-carrier-protein] synthase II
MLALEEYERAVSRKAKIYAEVIGYHNSGSEEHVSQSNRESIVLCLGEALESAGVSPGDIDYINAHGTATLHGDKVEAKAIREVFGDGVPVSSLKGYMGHTLGASGALELIVSLAMMERRTIYPTLNLENVDEDCQGLHHVMKPLSSDIRVMMKNCFAFGGINAALVCRRMGS